MKKNKKIISNVILIFLSIIISTLIEIVFFNGIRMYNFNKDKGTFSLKDYTIIETKKEEVPIKKSDKKRSIFDVDNLDDSDENSTNEIENLEDNEEKLEKEIKILKIKFEKKYIDRLVFKYKINYNTQMGAEYETFDEYGNPKKEMLYLTFLKDFNTITRVIQNDVDYIEFKVDLDSNVDFSIEDIQVKNEFCFNIYRFLLISIFLVSITLIYIFRKTVLNKIEYLFVIIALCTGLSQIFLIPCLTLYSCDDHIHLERIYTLFETGEVNTTKSFNYSYGLRLEFGDIPRSYEEFNMINKYLNDNNNINDKPVINDNKYISYDNFTYIPSAIGVYLCKIFKVPYTMLFHIGKIVNLLVYIGIMFYAIKKAKVGKKLLFILSLLPSTIYLAAQYSRDAIITAGIYLAISTFLNCYCTKEKMNRKNLLIFVISVLIACLSKQIYIPFLFLIILIPKEKFENSKNSKWIKILIILLMLGVMLTFIMPAATSSSSSVGDIRGGNASTGGQLQLIISQPVSFAKVFLRFVEDVISSKVISSLTLARWHNFTVFGGEKYLLLLLSIIFASFITDKDEKKYKIDWKVRILFLTISLLIICFICGSMYLSFTPVGSTEITGVQERYYIPLLFAIFICFKNSKVTCNIEDSKVMLIISTILMYIYFFEIYNSIFLDLCV